MIKKSDHTKRLSEWNDCMYQEHPTPYESIIAGIIERKRLEKIIDLCSIKESDHILEIGCESGHILSKVGKVNRLVGVDISEIALSDSKKRLNGNAELIFADFEKPVKKKSLQQQSFDVIICSQVLEHVVNPDAIMKNIYKLAKKDARIVISVPNELFMLSIKKMIKKIGIMDLLLPGIEPKISEWHLQIFTHNEVKRLISSDFEVVKFRRAYNIYLIYLLKKLYASV